MAAAKKKRVYYDKCDVPDNISNRAFQKVLQFYLFECPVNNTRSCVSVRGQKFRDYGFVGQAKYGKLKSAMMKSATPSLKENYFPCKSHEVAQIWQEKLSIVSPPDEYCVFHDSSQETKMESLFSAIRNAFAHGSFNVKTYGKERIYFLANDHNGMKARIVLHEETLLSWITLVKNGCMQ